MKSKTYDKYKDLMSTDRTEESRKNTWDLLCEEAWFFDQFGVRTRFIDMENGKNIDKKMIVLCGIIDGLPDEEIPYYDSPLVRDEPHESPENYTL